ncbi:MAG: transglutaminase-like putative cysteine protease [Candidatus Latescibacterota bacterium]|jgi:transglutaminase-like putative cysteine protease
MHIMSQLKRNKKALFGVASVLVLCAVFWYVSKPQSQSLTSYSQVRTIQYSFNIKNESNKVLTDVDFFSYAPVELTSTQKVIGLEASHEFEIQKDEYYNQVMHFVFAQVAPYETIVVRVRAELAFSDFSNSNSYSLMNSEHFLGKEQYIEVDAPAIINTAQRYRGENHIDTLQKIYNFTDNYINYSGYIKEDLGASYALEKRLGDCTEYSYLVAALSRASEIPARVIGGYVYPANATLKPKDYHNWNEVFHDGRWHILDAQKRSFMENQSHYIAMRVLVPDSSSLLGNSHQFAYSQDHVQINMN